MSYKHRNYFLQLIPEVQILYKQQYFRADDGDQTTQDLSISPAHYSRAPREVFNRKKYSHSILMM